MSAEVATVFWAVVIARFALPLLIPRFPLPALIACLVLDAVDQTVFQSFGFDPPGYQGYDKAMDNFYLAMAYLATLRNWTSLGAVRIGRGLFFYRLVGVVVFELTGWRPLLLLFPNTFEYFFIAYEAVRSRWDPLRISTRGWLITAATIWVVVKLPQEYWIHVAQLDFTDAVRDLAWFGPAVVIGLVALAGVSWFVVRPRLIAPDWGWRIAADPLPEAMDTGVERAEWMRRHGRLLSVDTAEKAVLVGLLSVIYAQVLPDLDSGPLTLFLQLSALVVASTAISLVAARRGAVGLDSAAKTFAVRLVLNLAIVVVAVLLPVGFTPSRGDLNPTAVGFFVVLLSLLSSLHDRYSPVHGVRREEADAAGVSPPSPGR